MGAELEPRPSWQCTFAPSPRFTSPSSSPASQGAPYPLPAGLQTLLIGGTSSRRRICKRMEPAAAATPRQKPLESLLGFSPTRATAPRGKQLSRSLLRPPTLRPLAAALQHRPGSGGRGQPLARRGRGLPAPLGPLSGAGCLQRPAARSPRPPPCALLTSFILSHPLPPTPFPNSDSPPARWQQRPIPLPLPRLSRRRTKLEKPVRLLKKKILADPPLSQPLKVQGRRGLAGGAGRL